MLRDHSNLNIVDCGRRSRKRKSILGHRINGRDRETRQRKVTGVVMLLHEVRGLWLPSVRMLLMELPRNVLVLLGRGG